MTAEEKLRKWAKFYRDFDIFWLGMVTGCVVTVLVMWLSGVPLFG